MFEILFAVLCTFTPRTEEALNSDGTKVQVTMGFKTEYRAVRVDSLEDFCIKPLFSSCRPELYALRLKGHELQLDRLTPVCIRPKPRVKAGKP